MALYVHPPFVKIRFHLEDTIMLSMFFVIALTALQPPQGTNAGTQVAPPGNQVQPPGNGNPQQFPNNQQVQGNGAGQHVMADGLYTIVAYEKFGAPLPGMTNAKVVIRNNILTFAGDGKLPGKMLQLSFGGGNTVTITPLDGTNPNPITPYPNNNNNTTNNNGTPMTNDPRQTVGTPPLNNKTSPTNTDPARAGQAGVANNGRQATGTPPLNNGQQPAATVPGNGITSPGVNTNTAMNPNSEFGVYVLSSEFFVIGVISQGGGNPYPPGNGVPPGNGIPPGNGVPPVRYPPPNGIEKHNPGTGTGNPGTGRMPAGQGGQNGVNSLKGNVLGNLNNNQNNNTGNMNSVQGTAGGTGGQAILILRRIGN